MRIILTDLFHEEKNLIKSEQKKKYFGNQLTKNESVVVVASIHRLRHVIQRHLLTLFSVVFELSIPKTKT